MHVLSNRYYNFHSTPHTQKTKKRNRNNRVIIGMPRTVNETQAGSNRSIRQLIGFFE